MLPETGMTSPAAGAASVGTVSGSKPARPNSTARSVPWPRPVAASEPRSSTRTLPAGSPTESR